MLAKSPQLILRRTGGHRAGCGPDAAGRAVATRPRGRQVKMFLDRIENLDILRPKMDSNKEVLHAIATFQADVSPAFWEDGHPLRREKFREKQG